MKPPLRVGLALYRRLASAYPHEFRMLYGQDLDAMGEDALPEVWRRYGLWGLLRLLADIAIRLPVEYGIAVRQDFTWAARGLVRSPGFTAVVVLSLAIGIGMCSVVLGGSNNMLGPLPGARDPGALLTPRRAVSYPYFEQYRAQQVVESAAVFLGPVPIAVSPWGAKRAGAQRFYGHLVSPEYFSTIGATPTAGRFFRTDSERPGSAPVVVVSYRFWRNVLNSDAGAVGRRLRLNGQTATIVGVASEGFLGLWPWNPVDLFVPLTCGPQVAPELEGDPLHQARSERFPMVLRLRPGVSAAEGGGALDAVTRGLDRQNPDPERDRDQRGRKLHLIPAGTIMPVTPEQRAFVWAFNFILWGIVVALLCANVGNLLLARGAQRRREIAVRLSVGAGRARLVRQILAESVLLALAGGLGAVCVALSFAHLMSFSRVPARVPTALNWHPDFRILAVTLAISLAAGIAFGLVPALVSLRTDIAVVLKAGAEAPLRRGRRFGLRNFFMGQQVAASLMLVLFCGYLVIGYDNATRLDPGFAIDGLSLLQIDPVRDGYPKERMPALLAALPRELARASGVDAAAVADDAPYADLASTFPNTVFSAPVGGKGGDEVSTWGVAERVGPGYFAALGAPLVRGHDFDRRDTDEPKPGRAGSAIINQSAARELFGGRDPIGRTIRNEGETYTIIGIARDTRSGLMPPKPVPTVFLPLTAASIAATHAPRLTVLVRGPAGRESLSALRDEVAALHPDLTVFRARTMRENVDEVNAFAHWSSSIYVALGLLAVLLASIGLGGVTAYAVIQRRKEIGIRMALGARAASVERLVLREGIVLAIAGGAVGFACAAALARAASTVTAQMAAIFQTGPDDPLLVVGAPLLLAIVLSVACYLPARQATRIDPVTALRDQ